MSKKRKKKNKIFVSLFSFIFLILFSSLAFRFLSLNNFGPQKNLANEVQNIISTTTLEKKVEVDVEGQNLLGQASISFSGSTEGRENNIKIGVSKINGTVIKPGAEFSFKDVLGTTTPELGYSVERIFLNGEVTKGIGGGICQVSSALFRSILSAGLPVTERVNHSYTVSYYDVGLDATYSDPGPDLKFINDTKHPITIKGKVENKKAVFEIYGRTDGRVASTTEAEITDVLDYPPTKYVYVNELEEGDRKCMNSPQIGYTAKLKYGVLYPNDEYKERDFVSKYKPLRRICYIVGDEIKDFDVNKILR